MNAIQTDSLIQKIKSNKIVIDKIIEHTVSNLPCPDELELADDLCVCKDTNCYECWSKVLDSLNKS